MIHQSPCNLSSWKALQEHYDKVNDDLYLPKLFSDDNDRFSRYSLSLNGVTHDGASCISFLIDYSKNLLDEKTVSLLLELAVESRIEEYREKLFDGSHVNEMEDRSVLHMALRNPPTQPYVISSTGIDIMPNIITEYDKMANLSNSIINGTWRGYTGKPIQDIVNIGIGGSDLGPHMVCQALSPFSQKSSITNKSLNVHFVSNIDGFDLESCLNQCSPETTLFIIVSKTFTTIETMTNASSAKSWMLHHNVPISDLGKHFVAVSTNDSAVMNFGIPNDDEHIFRFWDWVGGRYSLWSSVGLSIFLYIGENNFRSLLDGAHWMDEHFKNAPLDENAPVMLALIGIWYNNFYKCETHAILPYEQSLSLLPRYLQQADMESNGKSVTRSNDLVSWSTGPIIWGEPGTNGQHAFYQLIHQGTKMIPIDFLAGLHPIHFNEDAIDREEHHCILFANCIAQSEALMNGTQAPDRKPISLSSPLATHRSFIGNKPSTTILYDRLNPVHLGALIALYEHKIFVQGVIWNIYSYDQWGVELGKKLALKILEDLKQDGNLDHHDASTSGLLKYAMNRGIKYRAMNLS